MVTCCRGAFLSDMAANTYFDVEKKCIFAENFGQYFVLSFVALELINNHLMYETGIGSEYFVETVDYECGCLLACRLYGWRFYSRRNMGKILLQLSRLNILTYNAIPFLDFLLISGFSGHPIIVRDFRIIGILAGILMGCCQPRFSPRQGYGMGSDTIHWTGVLWNLHLAGILSSHWAILQSATGQEWPLSDPLLGVLLLVITVPISYHLYEKIFLDMKKKFQRVPMVNESE